MIDASSIRPELLGLKAAPPGDEPTDVCALCGELIAVPFCGRLFRGAYYTIGGERYCSRCGYWYHYYRALVKTQWDDGLPLPGQMKTIENAKARRRGPAGAGQPAMEARG